MENVGVSEVGYLDVPGQEVRIKGRDTWLK